MPKTFQQIQQFLGEGKNILLDKTAPAREYWQQFRQKHPRRATAIQWVSLSSFIGFSGLFLFCSLVYFGAFGALPTYTELENIQNHIASEVYSEDGVLLGKYYIENRVNADFEDISPNIINALVATEDARFFEHSGIDFRAWLRVFFRTIIGGDTAGGGGSTLSQQLAKNLYERKQFKILSTPIAKVREMFIARRLERVYSKEALLNLYLNTVPFGNDIFGVKVAAQRFFNTSPKEISIEDAAVLVGMLKANTKYNPHKNPKKSMHRRNVVLAQMVKYDYLESNVYDSLKMRSIQSNYYKEGNNQGLATYFREYLRQEVAELLADKKKPDGTPYNLYTDGLKIYTTLDARLQKLAETALTQQMAQLQEAYFKHWKNRKGYGDEALFQRAKKQSERYKRLAKRAIKAEAIEENFQTAMPMRIYDWKTQQSQDTLMSPNDSLKYYLSMLHAGFLAANPHSGKILAWVGGIEHQHFKYDHVKSKRQVGSTFKPIVYAQALQQNIPPCDYIDNLLVNYTQYDNWTPKNSNGQYGGIYSMEGALSHSVNVATVDLVLRTGIDSVRNLANNMGIQQDLPSGPAIALGTVDASLWEMVQVYGTFANSGKRPELHFLKRVETAEGEILVDLEIPNPEVFPEVIPDSVAQMMTQMLQSVVDSGTAKKLRYHYRLYNDIAGKTGTTQNHADGWFMGYTPNLVAGVWVGGSSPKIRFRSMKLGQGANTALPIFGQFMKSVYQEKDFEEWKKHKFPPLDSTLKIALDCPPFLESRDMIPSLYDSKEEEDMPLFDWIESIFVSPKEHKSKRHQSRSKQSERIEKRNKKLEKKRAKRKKRKSIFERF